MLQLPLLVDRAESWWLEKAKAKIKAKSKV